MILLNILILIFFVIVWIISKNYNKDDIQKLNKNEHKLVAFYPLGLFLMDKLRIDKNKDSHHLEEPLRALYVGNQLDYIKKMYLCNKVVITVLIIFLANFFALLSNLQAITNKQLLDGKYLQRPGYEDGNKTVELKVNVSDKDSTILEEDMELDVEEKHYTKKELNQKFEYAKNYIDNRILNKNESSEKIISDLNFISRIPDTGLAVTWTTGDDNIIDAKGTLHNEELDEELLIWVTAHISYENYSEEYTRYFKVIPKQYTMEELTRKNLTDALNAANEQSKTEDRLTLPDSINKLHISWAEREDKTGWLLLPFGIVLAYIMFKLMDRDLYDKVEKRNREMLLDYPEIINKFTLLVGAGMSLSNAWGKITRDYKEKGAKTRYAYEEMNITYGELTLGTSEITAYERFGRRVKLIPYLRFSLLLAQNVKKGSSELLRQLELEAAEAFEERKELAKRMGEEAGTKLLVPMMLMLIIVLVIILVPAFISLQL